MEQSKWLFSAPPPKLKSRKVSYQSTRKQNSLENLLTVPKGIKIKIRSTAHLQSESSKSDIPTPTKDSTAERTNKTNQPPPPNNLHHHLFHGAPSSAKLFGFISMLPGDQTEIRSVEKEDAGGRVRIMSPVSSH